MSRIWRQRRETDLMQEMQWTRSRNAKRASGVWNVDANANSMSKVRRKRKHDGSEVSSLPRQEIGKRQQIGRSGH